MASPVGLHGTKQLLIELHCHESGYRVLGNANARIAKIEGIILALDGRDIDVHEFDWFVGRIVDGMGVAHPHRCAGRPLQDRRASVDRELRLTVKDDEHLFALIVKVMTNASTRHDLAAMHELQIGGQGTAGQERLTRHVAGAVMRAAAAILTWIGVADALSQRLQREQGQG